MSHLIKTVRSGYGWRTDPNTGQRRFHHGIDEDLDHATPLYAQFTGTFHRENASGRADGRYHSYGWYYDLISPDGLRRARVAHLSRFVAADGAKVEAGELVAYSGGRAGAIGAGSSTGDHAHVEDWIRSSRSAAWQHRDPTKHLGSLHHPKTDDEEADVTDAQAKQLADIHYTLTHIPGVGGGRVPLHVWAAQVNEALRKLAAGQSG